MEASPAARSSRMSPLAWLLLGLSAAWCVVWFVHARGYWEDDSWIHLEFARSVAMGRGFSFNGHIVYGDTSPLWVWLLVAFHAVIPAWMMAGKTLTAVGAVFALSGVFAFSRSLVQSRLASQQASIFAALMVLVLVTNPYFGYWAFSGMEALTAAGLVCWGALAVAPRTLSPPRFLLGSLIAGVAPLLRPEMSFFTVLLGLILLQRLLAMPVPTPRRIVLFCAGFFLIAAPFVVWGRYALHTFGMVVPNTNAAKRAGPHDNVVARLINIYTFGFPVITIGVLLLVAFAMWYLARGRRQGSAPVLPLLHAGGWLLFVWTAINCVFYVVNHTYVQTRYIFVTAPVLTIAIFAIAAQRWPRLYRPLAAFALLFGIAVSLLATWPLIANKTGVDRDYAALAAFLRTLPPDAPVAHYSIGEAAYLSEHPLVDTGGITRPGIIPFLWDDTDDRRIAWIYSQGAKYYVVDHQPVAGSVLLWSRDIPTTGWFLNPRKYAGKERLQLWTLPAHP